MTAKKEYKTRRFYASKYETKEISLERALDVMQSKTVLNMQDCYIEIWECEVGKDDGECVALYNGAGEKLKKE